MVIFLATAKSVRLIVATATRAVAMSELTGCQFFICRLQIRRLIKLSTS